MKLKIKAIYSLLIVLGCLCFSNGSLKGQRGMLSPYSAFGVGVDMPYLNVRNLAMGGINIGLAGKGNITPFNPASILMGVDTMSVMFDVGFNMSMNTLAQNRDARLLKNQSMNAGLSNLEFYFPIFKWWKMGVYLVPVTDISYLTSDFVEYDAEHVGQTQLTHEGSGGVSRLGWGNAFGWGPVAVGVNLNYQFGKEHEDVSLFFLEDTVAGNVPSSNFYRLTRINGLVVDVGLMYSQKLNKGRSALNIGASYSLKSRMHATRYSLATAVHSTTTDTAYLSEEQKGIVVMPSVLRAGISFEQYRNFLVGVDFTYTWWNEYSDYGESVDFFHNTWRVGVGMELKADLQSTLAFRKFSYRLGGMYETYHTTYNGKVMAGFGVSIGMGFPIRRAQSMINVGFDYIRRGDLAKGQVREDFFRLGVSFTSIETWFVKRKYD